MFNDLSFLVGSEHWIAGSIKSHGIHIGWLKLQCMDMGMDKLGMDTSEGGEVLAIR